MRKMFVRLSITILVIACIIASCETIDKQSGSNTYDITGIWLKETYEDSILTFQKTEVAADDEYWLSIREDHTLTEHKNAGWCGTPPISYADFEGTWELNDSIIEITVGFWGGLADYTWKILSVTDSKLRVFLFEQVHYMDDPVVE
jgi:hypothetical protein